MSHELNRLVIKVNEEIATYLGKGQALDWANDIIKKAEDGAEFTVKELAKFESILKEFQELDAK